MCVLFNIEIRASHTLLLNNYFAVNANHCHFVHLDFVQCTFLNVALQDNGGKSSAVIGGNEIPCPRLNDGNVEDDVSDNDFNSNAVVKIDFARPYLIDTVRITESGNAAESEKIRIFFSDGSNVWVSSIESGQS